METKTEKRINIADMARAIYRQCIQKPNCYRCPLFDVEAKSECYDINSHTDEEIAQNYEIMFGEVNA